MAIMGDKMQMAGFGDNRPWDSRLWRQSTLEIQFWQPYRCIDQEYQKILDGIRMCKPEGDLWDMMKKSFL
eukprot:5096385-Karenia_brevis.AAC.1